MLKYIGAGIIVVLLPFGCTMIALKNKEYFGPKFRSVDQKIFKESEQYNDSMIRELSDLQLEYIKASPEQKETLRAVVLHKFSVYPVEKMPSDLRNFYTEIRGL